MKRLHSPQTWPPYLQIVCVCFIYFMFRSIRFAGPTDMTLNLAWGGVLLAGSLFPFAASSTGIVISSFAAYFLFPPSFNRIVYENQQFALEITPIFGYLLSLWMISTFKNKFRMRPAFKFIALIAPVILSIRMGLSMNPDRFIWIYTLGIAIISLLTFIRSRRLNQWFWLLFDSWWFGFLFIFITYFAFDLDSNAGGGMQSYLRRHFIVPYPMYLLLILVSADLANAVHQHFSARESQ